MADSGKELPTLDFGSMIGGPLVAVINAQAQAAMATVHFIHRVGFRPDGEPVTLPFRYRKSVAQADGSLAEKMHEISVPLLSLVSIPSIRIQETQIDFNAKVVSVSSSATSSATDGSGATPAGGSRGPAQHTNPHMVPEHPVLQVSFSHRQKTSQGQDTNKSYAMNVRVTAVHDDIPAGLERLLSRLEQHTLEQPVQDKEHPDGK